MTWKPDEATVTAVANTLRMARIMRGCDTRLLGRTMSTVKAAETLERALGVERTMSDREIAVRLAERVADPIAPGTGVEVDEVVAGVEFGAPDLDLARHMGVDLARLLVVGQGEVARVTDGGRAVSVRPTWTADGRLAVGSTFTLARGVSWSDGRLTARRWNVPEAMLRGMRGKSMAEIVEHDWEGWRRLEVANANKGGGTLRLATRAA